MKNYSKTLFHSMVLSVFLFFFAVVSSYGGDYPVLNGLTEAKIVFDVRTKSPQIALTYLNLIHSTFTEKNIREITDKPEFVVVFIGPAVKLVSTDSKSFSDEDKEILGKIATTISAMAQDGIKFEICLFAASLLGVDPSTILPEIDQYDNGWISIFGYQAKGYQLVPAY